MLSHSLPSLPPPQSQIFSKWSLDASSGGFVDEAQFTKVVCEDELNTVKLSVFSGQVEAYTPIEDKLYVNEKDQLFAVFDGHGGDICSRFVVDRLPKNLLSSLKRRQPVHDSDFTSVLKTSFMQTDDQFLVEHRSIVKSCPAGSCGVSVLVRNDTLYVCNLGDSRVLLGSNSSAGWTHKLLTNDHNTKNEAEVQLVKRRTTDPNPIRGHLINQVEGERVGGILMVTRAFGDGIFKRREMSVPPLIQHLPYITNEPEVTAHKLQPEDSYAIIASDGLYEYLTPAKVAELVEQHIESGLDGSKIATVLIEKQFEIIAKLVGKTVDQVKRAPNRKTFMDDTSIIVLIFSHRHTSPKVGAAAE